MYVFIQKARNLDLLLLSPVGGNMSVRRNAPSLYLLPGRKAFLFSPLLAVGKVINLTDMAGHLKSS